MMDTGKMPPQAVEFEEMVLGAAMLEREAYESVSTFLKPEMFYKKSHQVIFRSILALGSRNEPVDIMTVVQELKKTGQLDAVGGAGHVASLTNRIASGANADFHAKIIAQKYIQRELARISTNLNIQAYDEGKDVFELMGDFEDEMNSLKGNFHTNKMKSTRDIVKNAREAIKNAKLNQGILGPSTGLRDLDAILRGLRRKNIYVIAGRPAMGKTAITLCIAKALCIDQNIPIAVFSLEMDSEQLMHRLLSDLSNIDNNHLASGNLNDSEELKLDAADKRVTDNFHFDDSAEVTIQYFELRVRKLVELGVEYVIIDYVQLMVLTEKDAKGKTEEQKVAFISKNLKRIAKKYNIGIIELSQLSRKCEDRDPPRPMLSDLRESGAIEQDADVVIFLYRPEYYNIEYTPSGKPSKGLAELIIAKHRNGPIDSVITRYKGEYTRFENLEPSQPDSMADVEQTQSPIF